jgi:hypothetical protein
MKKLENFGASLSRDEMRNVNAGIAARLQYNSCNSQPDCNFQSPAWRCNSGNLPVCHQAFCTQKDGLTSTDNRWGCQY